MNTTLGMGLLKPTTTCQAGGQRGRRRRGTRGSQRGWWWTGRRGGRPKSGGKGQGALTTLWRGGSDMRGGETSLRRGAESGRPAAAGGRWRDSWRRGGRPTGEERTPSTDGPSRLTGGGRGRLTDGSGRSESATGRGKIPAGSTIRAAGTRLSSAGGRTRSAAPTSASEGLLWGPHRLPHTMGVEERVRELEPSGFRRREDIRHLLILQTFYADEILKKKKVLCLMYNIKESIFQCILFF